MTFRAKSRHSLSHSITSSARNRSGDFRTILGVPLFREGIPIGVLLLQRAAVQPFTDKQIKLVETFADQAVIAIENVRLFEAEQQRSRELSESLEQQTATSDVLRVISSSPSDIQPVLETIGERAGKLCNADVSAVSIVDGELIRLASIHGMTVAGVEASRRAFPVRRTDETVHARAIRTRSVCHVADVVSDPQYQLKDTARVSGYRGCLGVPMVRDEQAVGAIVVARREPGLFSDAQVQLLKTFADQAVIAIENVRLFKEIGLVANLSRPGGNVTGLSMRQAEIASKRLALLREVVPGLRRLAIMFDSGYPASVREIANVQAAARTLGLEVTQHEIRRAEDIASVFDAIKGQTGALYVVENALMSANADHIIALALSAKLPTTFTTGYPARAGALMSYGPNVPALFRHAADYVDKILHGMKPGDLPVEQPTQFDFVINLKTAKALGLTVPHNLLVLAEEVIE
jgi:GAF domain-containing protein